jgi:tetratricopeptide (TPR) repeat protein
LNGIADGLYQQGQYLRAQAVWQRALVEAKKFGSPSKQLATTYSNLAMVATSLGHPEDALPMHKKAVAMLQSVTGKDSVDTANAKVNEAECLRGLKRYSEAEPLYKAAIPILEKEDESSQHDTLLTLNNLALCYKQEGKLKEAEDIYKDTLAKAESETNGNKQMVAILCTNLGSLFKDEKKLSEAEEVWKRAIEIGSKDSQGANAFGTAVTMNNLALLYEDQNKKAEAEDLFKQSLDLVKANLGTGSGPYQTVFINYLASLVESGRKAAAHELLAYAQAHNSGTLHTSIFRMDKNPKAAERELKTLDLPAAKAYLAYLYFTHKVVIPHPSKTVDKLMNEAIQQTRDGQSFGACDPSQKYHYTDLSMLLQHLRFITDFDGLEIGVPESIFKSYPQAAFEAFHSWWGASGDGYLNIDYDPKEDVCHIPAVGRFKKALDDMLGDLNPATSGTIQYAFSRNRYLSFVKASLGPKAFISVVKKNSDEPNLPVAICLEAWSNQELWNKVKYKEWLRASKEAEAALAKHYVEHFGFDEQKALHCAKGAVAEINTTYIVAPISDYDKIVSSFVYKTFHRDGLTVPQMRQALRGRVLNSDQLREALRLAILNDASVDVIKWILKRKPALIGDREPALFSAVLRPEVVDSLLKAGADVNETNVLGKTAMFQACQFNSLGSVQKLHAAGAQIGDKMESLAVNENDTLKFNSDYNYTVGGRTPLMYAAAFASPPVIRYLVDHGADKSVVDSSGKTAEKYLADNKLISKVERRNLATVLHQHVLKKAAAPDTGRE